MGGTDQVFGDQQAPSHLASPLLSTPAGALLTRGEAKTQVSAGLGRAGCWAGEGSL